MNQLNKNNQKESGFRLICLNCGNTIIFNPKRHERQELDSISIYPYQGYKAVSIVCESCESETTLY